MILKLYDRDGKLIESYTDEHGYDEDDPRADGEAWMSIETEGGRGNSINDVIEFCRTYDNACQLIDDYGHVVADYDSVWIHHEESRREIVAIRRQ